jgi:hypothetical protein
MTLPVLAAALSSRRRLVVPTAINPPARRPHRVQPLVPLRHRCGPIRCASGRIGIVGLDRQESARADMQRQRLVPDPGSRQRRHQFRREMQRRGGRGDRAVPLRRTSSGNRLVRLVGPRLLAI